MQRSVGFILLGGALTLLALVYWNSRVGLRSELAAYRAESADISGRSVDRVSSLFDEIYRALRTIARLPGVRQIGSETGGGMDRGGAVLDGNTRLTVQEIYNSLVSDVAVSELYIVPVDLDPDGLDPLGLAPREPLTTFDEFVVGRTTGDRVEYPGGKYEEIEEIEIYEYRLMREQLQWMLANYPNEDYVDGLVYPMRGGSPVVTCDNSRFVLAAPDDDNRAGLVLSVPFFGEDGDLRGCVSGVILSHALSGLLANGDYAIFNSAYEYVVPPREEGQWAVSRAAGVDLEPDSRLLYSEVHEITKIDHGGTWYLWASFPDTRYWSRSGVIATLHSRSLGFAAVLILALGAMGSMKLLLRAYGRLADTNAGLEKTVSDRTSALLDSRDAAVRALGREQVATADLELVMVQLEELASTDKLTGLANRAIFLDRLDQTMKRSRRDGSRFAVLFFDFDRFKVVNDSLGHEVGDALLRKIAGIFRRELRETDAVARFGGDEFVALLDCLPKWEDAELKAGRLLDVFANPHDISGNRIVSTASIGLVTNERAYEDPGEMVRDADAAMYEAKANGRAQVAVFDKTMHASAMDRLSIEADLRVALSDEQFRLVYQPIVELESGEVTGFEALIRWDHPERGVISPADFIPIAEDTGLILPIGRWVLRTAASQHAQWRQRLGPGHSLKINVNVSKRQLLEPGFLDDVIDCQRDFALQAGDLELEITESTIADDRSDVVPLLTRLREHGFSIAMDDFGTGLSSLGSLHALPIDQLKIDQAFIRVLDRDRSLLAVVASITSLAENLGIRTVAEGIETGEIVGALQSIGCTWGQGYFFAKPMPPDEAEAYLFRHRQRHPRAA